MKPILCTQREGLIALAWLVVGLIVTTIMGSFSLLPPVALALWMFFGWWGIPAVLGLSAARRSTGMNQVCGALSLGIIAVFMLLALFVGVFARFESWAGP